VSAAALFLFLAGAARAAPAAHAARPAPAFHLPTRGGGTVASDSLGARVVLVDFWASWCEPCRKSFPWLAAMRERYGSKGLVIVAINLDKSRDAAEAFLEKYPAPFVVAFDPAGKTAEAFHVAAMPTSFVVGPDGAILASHAGFDPKKTGAFETLIQEACAR
jgi:thiol-disulfide isomerase/thioredoxin